MTRIDHAAEARRYLRDGFSHVAQVHATLALVEQQLIANLIALAKIAGRDEDVHEEVSEAAYEALNALVRYKVVPNGHMDPNEVAALHPDIAAALGIEAQS